MTEPLTFRLLDDAVEQRDLARNVAVKLEQENAALLAAMGDAHGFLRDELDLRPFCGCASAATWDGVLEHEPCGIHLALSLLAPHTPKTQP